MPHRLMRYESAPARCSPQPSEDHSNRAVCSQKRGLIRHLLSSQIRDLIWQLENTGEPTLMLGTLRLMPISPLAFSLVILDLPVAYAGALFSATIITRSN
jgi:hypothetical protein